MRCPLRNILHFVTLRNRKQLNAQADMSIIHPLRHKSQLQNETMFDSLVFMLSHFGMMMKKKVGQLCSSIPFLF